MTYAAYLAFEQSGDHKYEYFAGQVYAMAGGTPQHAQLTAAVIATLRDGTAARPCAVFSSDLKVRIDEVDVATYPDAAVVCDERLSSPVDELAVTNPTVVVEVTSPDSEAYDRGEKFEHYRRLKSLHAYVLVAHDRERIEVYERTSDGWRLREAGSGEVVAVEALDLSFEVSAIYRDPLSGATLAVPRRDAQGSKT